MLQKQNFKYDLGAVQKGNQHEGHTYDDMQNYFHNMSHENPLFAGEVKRHNVRKRHGFLDTDFKQTGPSPFSPCYPNEIKKSNCF